MCSSCQFGKHVRLPFSSSASVSYVPFQIIHADVWTSPVPSCSGFKYYLVLIDDLTHYVWTFPLRSKADVFACILSFHAYVSTQFQLPILSFQTDNGKEFDNQALRAHFATHGIVFRLSCPYTSSQNGTAERIIRTLNDCVRSMLLHAGMPPSFWVEALATMTPSQSPSLPSHRLSDTIPTPARRTTHLRPSQGLRLPMLPESGRHNAPQTRRSLDRLHTAGVSH